MDRDPDPPIVAAVRRFVDEEVRPAARALEHADAYPAVLVDRLRALGLFGALVPAAYGGLGLDVTTYARVIEALCRGWMSLAGVLNSHTMAALIVLHHGTEEQRRRFLPRFARAEARGGLCLTEPHAGTDVQAIRTAARREGDGYRIDGTKMFVTNGREGNTFALLAVTDPRAQPRYRGMSCFIVEKGAPGLSVVKSIVKLGYKGVDTAELVFDGFVVPAANLVGGVEGRGFAHVLGGLETGRINIAARAVGVAQAAWDVARAHARATGVAPPALATMASRLGAARRLTYWAAGMKDRGERCDLEAGMAKLFASETAQELAVAALQIHGEAGTLERLSVERYYRDTPLMIIGEGTNEIQRTIIARNLVERYGERLGALTSREGEPEERRQMVLAVRQFVDKALVPLAGEADRRRAYPPELLASLAELGILGALVPPDLGGLGLDARTTAMLVEELARGASALAAMVAGHLVVTRALADAPRARRERLLPRMTRGEALGSAVLGAAVRARREAAGWRLDGAAPLADLGATAACFLVAVDTPDGAAAAVVDRTAPGIALGDTEATLGARGLAPCPLALRDVRVDGDAVLPTPTLDAALDLARLLAAANAVGVAQAAFEAALRYAQQRTTFGKPIAQHQAIQLKLADMATRTTAARLLLYAAADGEADPIAARLWASEVAYETTLESMRTHGGYGYTAEFPVERYYRDAARLLVTPRDNARERAALAARLVARS